MALDGELQKEKQSEINNHLTVHQVVEENAQDKQQRHQNALQQMNTRQTEAHARNNDNIDLPPELEHILRDAGVAPAPQVQANVKKKKKTVLRSRFSGIEINDHIRFEQAFAQEQKADSGVMKKVRTAMRTYFEMENSSVNRRVTSNLSSKQKQSRKLRMISSRLIMCL